MSIDQQELDELCEKLKNLQLSDSQRALLDAILKIAWDFAGSHATLEEDFDGCFEPDQAAVITAYPAGAQTNSITRSVGSSSITRSVGSGGSASSITR